MPEHRLVQVGQLEEGEVCGPPEGVLQQRQEPRGQDRHHGPIHQAAHHVRQQPAGVALDQGEGQHRVGVGEAEHAAGAEEGGPLQPSRQGEDPHQAPHEGEQEVLDGGYEHDPREDGEDQRAGEGQPDVEQDREQDAAQGHRQGGPQGGERDVGETLVEGGDDDEPVPDEQQDDEEDRAEQHQAAGAPDLLGLQGADIGVQRAQQEGQQQEDPQDRECAQGEGQVGTEDLERGQEEEGGDGGQEPALLLQPGHGATDGG